MQLRPFQISDAAIVASWFTDEYTFRLWSADRYNDFPLTADKMLRYYGEHRLSDRLTVLTATEEDGRVIGHITLRYPHPDDSAEVRLGFVVVDPSLRGHGLGREMVMQAVEYAFWERHATRVSIGVFSQNESAIRCYYSCGFSPANDLPVDFIPLMNETWECRYLSIER